MKWAIPENSRSQVNRAGETLKNGFNFEKDPDLVEYILAFDILVNWRSCHAYPINTFQSTLRSKLKTLDPNALVSQRLKRAQSIIEKLSLPQRTQLARMQDIGGLRAVVKDMKTVETLVENYKKSRFLHELIRSDDYITYPKDSGYRSVHLVYRYKSILESGIPYNGLRIELQIRTRLQHAWATAVETMGTFLQQPLKASQGPDEWLSFFALCGSAFAHAENTKPLEQYSNLSNTDTYNLVKKQARELDVQASLAAFSIAARNIETDNQPGSFHLVTLDTSEMKVMVQSFGRGRLNEANISYADVEKEISKGAPLQVVLVSASSIDQLKKSYPSYFLDTREFIKQLNKITNAPK